MAWEKRGQGRKYYSRSKRVEGKIVREYVGAGEKAERIAEADQQAKEAAARQGEEQRQRRAQWAHEDEQITTLCAQIEQAARQAMQQAGYQQHARGEWRKKRGIQA